MLAQRNDDARRQDRHTIPAALGIAYDNFAAHNEEIFDAKPMRFHQAQPAAIK